MAFFRAHRILKGCECNCAAVERQALERRLQVALFCSSPLGCPFRACYEHTILAMLLLPHLDKISTAENNKKPSPKTAAYLYCHQAEPTAPE